MKAKITIKVPSVGRMVHYRSASYPQPLAALVCSVALPNNPYSLLNLLVIDPYGATLPMLDVAYSENQIAHWSWPIGVPPMTIDAGATDHSNNDE